jgi:hypothetical protein
MAQRCEYLVKCQDAPSDKFIWQYIHNQDLLRRVSDTFSYDDIDHCDIKDAMTTELTAKAFIREINPRSREIPVEMQKNGKHYFSHVV